MEYLLGTGLVRWCGIKWSLQSTAHVPCEVFAQALQIMERACQDKSYAKFSINSMIGLFGRDVSQAFSMRSSSSEIDGAGHDFRQKVSY